MLCASLREAELAMPTDSARATALTEALLVTINRDSTAIWAHDYSAAQRQYVHFRTLHSQLRRVLASKVSNGARVAAVLRSVGVSGVLSSAVGRRDQRRQDETEPSRSLHPKAEFAGQGRA
jgi:hypothetical protein